MTVVQPTACEGRADRHRLGRREACGSTASSRRGFPGLSFSHIQRIIRKGEVRVNGKRAQPKDRLQAGQAVRIPPLKLERRSRARTPPRTRRTAPSSSRSRCTRTTTCWCSTSRWGLRCRAAPAPMRHLDGMLGRAARQGRPAAAAGAPPRQGHRRLPAGGEDPLRRRGAGEDLPLALGAQDLLGAGRGRAEAAAGPDLDLPRQGGARGRKPHAHRQAWRRGREPRRDLLRGGRDRGAAACLAVAQAGDRPHPPVARPHEPYRPPDRGRPEIFLQGELGISGRHPEPAAPAGATNSRCRIRAAARSTSPRRCRRTCSSRGT